VIFFEVGKEEEGNKSKNTGGDPNFMRKGTVMSAGTMKKTRGDRWDGRGKVVEKVMRLRTVRSRVKRRRNHIGKGRGVLEGRQ